MGKLVLVPYAINMLTVPTATKCRIKDLGNSGTTMSVVSDHNIRACPETNVWEDLISRDGQPNGPATPYPFMTVKVRMVCNGTCLLLVHYRFRATCTNGQDALASLVLCPLI